MYARKHHQYEQLSSDDDPSIVFFLFVLQILSYSDGISSLLRVPCLPICKRYSYKHLKLKSSVYVDISNDNISNQVISSNMHCKQRDTSSVGMLCSSHSTGYYSPCAFSDQLFI